MARDFANSSGIDYAAQDAIVVQWSSMVISYMRGAAAVLQHGKEGTIDRKTPLHTERRLEDSLRSSTRVNYGVISSVSIQFERHGVFVHKGVGRGYHIQGGVVIRTAKSDAPGEGDHSFPRNKKDRMVERHPYEWFNPVIDETLPELANKLAEINADAAVNATRMTIN